MLPAAPNTCEQCAVTHAPEMPHNAQSLFYQYHFYAQHQRWPNWTDAMSHCTPEMQAHWIAELNKAGVDVAGGKINPSRK